MIFVQCAAVWLLCVLFASLQSINRKVWCPTYIILESCHLPLIRVRPTNNNLWKYWMEWKTTREETGESTEHSPLGTRILKALWLVDWINFSIREVCECLKDYFLAMKTSDKGVVLLVVKRHSSSKSTHRTEKRWRLYIIPQYLANLTQPISKLKAILFLPNLSLC